MMVDFTSSGDSPFKEGRCRTFRSKGSSLYHYDVEVWPAVLRDATTPMSRLWRAWNQRHKADLDTIVRAIDDAEVDASVVLNGVSAMDSHRKVHHQRFSLLRWIICCRLTSITRKISPLI